MYPTKDEFKQASEEYLIQNETEFYEQMDDTEWNTFYVDKFAKPVIFNLIRFKSISFKLVYFLSILLLFVYFFFLLFIHFILCCFFFSFFLFFSFTLYNFNFYRFLLHLLCYLSSL